MNELPQVPKVIDGTHVRRTKRKIRDDGKGGRWVTLVRKSRGTVATAWVDDYRIWEFDLNSGTLKQTAGPGMPG